jgi:hypothetical protein
MKNHSFLPKFTKNCDFFAFFSKILKNQYFSKKIGKMAKNVKNQKYQKLPMKSIGKKKKAFMRLRLV